MMNNTTHSDFLSAVSKYSFLYIKPEDFTQQIEDNKPILKYHIAIKLTLGAYENTIGVSKLKAILAEVNKYCKCKEPVSSIISNLESCGFISRESVRSFVVNDKVFYSEDPSEAERVAEEQREDEAARAAETLGEVSFESRPTSASFYIQKKALVEVFFIKPISELEIIIEALKNAEPSLLTFLDEDNFSKEVIDELNEGYVLRRGPMKNVFYLGPTIFDGCDMVGSKKAYDLFRLKTRKTVSKS